ncbi:hypothetical protein FF1_004955 [Malus domestica]
MGANTRCCYALSQPQPPTHPEYIPNRIRNENAIISVHCHNDFDLATANAIAGAYAGARQLEVTINGIGEGAVNASLEELNLYFSHQ